MGFFEAPPTPEQRLEEAKKISALKKGALPLIEEILRCSRELHTLGVTGPAVQKIRKHAALLREQCLLEDPFE